MRSEYDSLQECKTWELTELLLGKKAISCKRVFQKKRNKDGEVERYKAWFVAYGCEQRYGIDFDGLCPRS